MLWYLVIGTSIFASGMLIEKRSSNKKAFCILACAILLFFSCFRGSFTSDHSSYTLFFDSVKNYDYTYIIQHSFYTEKGFVLLNKLLSEFFKNNIAIIIFMAVVTIVSFSVVIKKYSPIVWISLLLFVSIGNYYDSFNVSRQIMAASIVFLGSSYIFKGKFFKYLLFILIASLFHRTSLLMIPIYFLLRFRIGIKSTCLLVFIGLVSIAILPSLVNLIQQRIFLTYQDYSYGMSGGNVKWLAVPLALLFFLVFTLVFKKNSNFIVNDGINNVLINALIIYVLLTIMGMRVSMISRISTFVQPFAWILIPRLISTYKGKERSVLIIIIVSLCLLYPLVTLSGTGYDPYYFIWQQQ